MIDQFRQDLAAIAARELPDDVRTIAQCCILDWFGVAIAGAREPASRMVFSETLVTADASCSIVGHAERTSPHSAALVNGIAGDALDFSDSNRAMNGHATATVFPAALAAAEACSATDAEVLRAFVVGVEAACRVGSIVGTGVLATPYHPTAVAGTIGAAVATALLMKLDDNAFAMALGIAGTQAAGLADAVGTMSKPLHAGMAASAGVFAARLAARGFTGIPNVLAANGGFLRAATDVARTDALEALRGEFLILDTVMKEHAACSLAAGSIENVLRLKATASIQPSDVASLRLDIAASSARVCGIDTPRSGLEAKFSVRTLAAMALLGYDTKNLATYRDEIVASDDIAAVRERITLIARDDFDIAVSRATIEDIHGASFTATTDERIFDRDVTRRRERTRAKFVAVTAPYVSPQRAARIEADIFGTALLCPFASFSSANPL